MISVDKKCVKLLREIGLIQPDSMRSWFIMIYSLSSYGLSSKPNRDITAATLFKVAHPV